MKYIILFIVFSLIYAFASESDYQEAVRSHRVYCEMVKDGVWPDYKGIYGKECWE